MNRVINTEVLIIGSGAGGATTACELSRAGFEVLVLEEGKQHSISDYGADSATAIKRLYRNQGMTPILGTVPMGFVEGCCLGGTTEINSGLWYRLPPETAASWQQQYHLQDFNYDNLEPHFEWAEKELSVSLRERPWPKNSTLLKKGADLMNWRANEVPRAASACVDTNKCASGCPKGAKQGVSLQLIPQARNAGAQFVPSCRVKRLLRNGSKITGAIAEFSDPLSRERHSKQTIQINAKAVFLCAGATQTPTLLYHSGIKHCVGNTFKIHPMLKVAALFDQQINSQNNVLPFVQVQEFLPDMSLCGAYFTPGYLAVTLGHGWTGSHKAMRDYRHMAMYSVTIHGTGKGQVRPSLLEEGRSTVRYELSKHDVHNLSQGLARLCMLLLVAGAKEIYPCVRGLPKITSTDQVRRWLDGDELLPPTHLGLTTVHAFSSCPMGELSNYCAADSFGKIFGLENLYINDASMLPDGPSVNPQGTIMAIARRNALHFVESATL
jgi:choline dehydrogenase-like flavoprotein